jgi:CheY-like chemotaxis protein
MLGSRRVRATGPAYDVVCHSCGRTFDAAKAKWCSCLGQERSFVCPYCHNCFCKAPLPYRQKFWRDAPQPVWDRKLQEAQAEFTPPPRPDPASVDRPLVLVVDDERDIQRVSTRVLEGLGYGVIIARNGPEGLELAAEYMPELILVDALMPKMDGREMCRQVKTNPKTAKIKVVVMTAFYKDAKYRTEGMRVYHADDYLAKPLDLAQMQALLRKHLG